MILLIVLPALILNVKPHEAIVYQDYNITVDYAAKSSNLYVINTTNDKIKYTKDSNKRVYPASLTKIMTAVVALEQIEDLSDTVSIDANGYQELINRNSSMAGFHPNEIVTYEDLLYGTLLSSGNEAANSLAINISGNIENFVDLMNKKVEELELNDTHFMNPEGLHHPDHYTTAEDVYRILSYALKNNKFKEIFSEQQYTTSKSYYHPEGLELESIILSKIIKLEDDEFKFIGAKSGYTYEAGRNLASLAIKNNQEYITIVIGAYPEANQLDTDNHMLDTAEVLKKVIY